ncbi:hypothetical protein GIB67_028915 [Kingdonia uniflora]|uniref:Uncharacterized protein n=1 Tax=Kingdonia uniflora TaxID=39325 RepID=A0A7J7LT34_9MAGN|nr:hypothetical protein GIB67_028915 [Kingdonia uniflora]
MMHTKIVATTQFQCTLDHILKGDSFSGNLKSFFDTAWRAFIYMIELSYVSLSRMLLLLITKISFISSKLSLKKRAIIGTLHVSVHMAIALILVLLLESSIEMYIHHCLLANLGLLSSLE